MTPLVLVRGVAYLALPIAAGVVSIRRRAQLAGQSHPNDLEGRHELVSRPTRAQMKQRRAHLERGGDPRSLDLRFCDLDRVRLAGMRMDGLDMSNASLVRASLEESKFAGANLDYVDLSKANLRNADLSLASVFETNLWKADLRGANLAGCRGIAMANLRGAVYDADTSWPSSFDPAGSGAIRVRGKRQSAVTHDQDALRRDARSTQDE